MQQMQHAQQGKGFSGQPGKGYSEGNGYPDRAGNGFDRESFDRSSLDGKGEFERFEKGMDKGKEGKDSGRYLQAGKGFDGRAKGFNIPGGPPGPGKGYGERGFSQQEYGGPGSGLGPGPGPGMHEACRRVYGDRFPNRQGEGAPQFINFPADAPGRIPRAQNPGEGAQGFSFGLPRTGANGGSHEPRNEPVGFKRHHEDNHEMARHDSPPASRMKVRRTTSPSGSMRDIDPANVMRRGRRE